MDINPDMAMAYLDFVPARHRVWEKRRAGEPGPWSDDPILDERKFTNVFRVLDHGSQYLLKLLNEPGLSANDVLARCYLYRMTNRPDVWEAMRHDLGGYPLAEDMGPELGELMAEWRDRGGQVFSGAYIIMPEPGVSGVDKARSVATLAGRLFHPKSPENVTERFLHAGMAPRFDLLHSLPSIGPFIAMQILTDFGYSPFGRSQDENTFVVPGPGCRNGARHIAPKAKAEDVIQWCRERVLQLPDCPMLPVPSTRSVGWLLRPPSWMDIQNTLCEFSKYARFMDKPSTGRPYVPAHPGVQPTPLLPHHWGN